MGLRTIWHLNWSDYIICYSNVGEIIVKSTDCLDFESWFYHLLVSYVIYYLGEIA